METALQIFCNHYAPCIPAAATDYFTTKELCTLIEQHTGSIISTTDLHQSLTDKSFTYDLVDGKFVWMMIKK
jgi:hypothetical protein